MLKIILSLLRQLAAVPGYCLADGDILLHPAIAAMDERERGDLPMEPACGCG